MSEAADTSGDSTPTLEVKPAPSQPGQKSIIIKVSVLVLCSYICGYFGFGILGIATVILVGVAVDKTQVKLHVREGVKLKLQAEEQKKIAFDPKYLQAETTTKYPDRETVEWFNMLLGKAWGLLEKMISESIVASLQPTLDWARPAFINSIYFETFTLGSQSPFFTSFKVLKVKNRTDYMMDMHLKYVSNADIVLRIRFGAALLWLNLPIQVQDLALDGTIRLEASLMAEPPYAKVVKFSFLEPPHINFDLIPLKAVDLTELPLVQAFLMEAVTEGIKGAMVYPLKIVLPLYEWQQVAAGDEPVTESVPADQATGYLVMRLHRMRNLVASDRGGTSDPYCITTFGTEKFRSNKVKKTLNPEYEEEYKFVIKGDLEMQFITVTVFDWDRIGVDDKLGEVRFALVDYIGDNATESSDNIWRKLDYPAEQGEVNVSFFYQPLVADSSTTNVDGTIKNVGDATDAVLGKHHSTSGVLNVTLVEARNLLAADKNGKSDPYVKFVTSGRKYKSSTKQKTLNPCWDQQFTMMIDNITDERLKANVFDRDAFTADDPLGELSIALDELTPGVEVDKWYHLEKTPTGEVHLRMTWIPIAGQGGPESQWPEAKKVNALAGSYEKPAEARHETLPQGAAAAESDPPPATSAGPSGVAPTTPVKAQAAPAVSTPSPTKSYEIRARGSTAKGSIVNQKAHRLYTFELEDGSNVWRIQKRYDEFEDLVDQLNAESTSFALPSLPGRKRFGRKGDVYYQEKSQALRGFIRALLANPRLREHRLVKAFLGSK